MRYLVPVLAATIQLAACSGGLGSRRRQLVDPEDLCPLAAADIASWSRWGGLARLQHSQLPACLGPVVRKGTYRTPTALLAADTFHPASGRTDVHVYWYMNPGAVELVEVRPRAALDAAPLLARLGAPEETVTYDESRLAATKLAAPPGGHVEEMIYAARGLAVVLAREPARAASVAALRGFEPTTVARYLDDWAPYEPMIIE